MKSLRVNSYDGRNKSFKNLYGYAKKDTSFNEKPTPLDFDSFISWFCLELQVSKNIVVKRINQAEYVRYGSKLSKGSSTKSSKLKCRSKSKTLTTIQSDTEDKSCSALPKISFATSTIDIEDAIPVTTYYDKQGRLVEIEIVGYLSEIPRTLIQAFNLCLPFHSGLSKLSIRKGGLCPTILYEIGKLLPHSNITDVCLDDTCVPEGSYSLLLDRPSRIKYLSLKRCAITDEECKKIAAKLDTKGPAMETLLLLDLTSNNITDEGAEALGDILKINRQLVYLNLSANKITDTGATFILRYLQEFPLTFNDISQARRRKMDYLISKSKTYAKGLEELKMRKEKEQYLENTCNGDLKTNSDLISLTLNVPHQSRHRKAKKLIGQSFIIEGTSVEDEAKKKTEEIIGEYKSPFDEQFIKRKGYLVYSVGNLTLSSLNLAYNDLSLLSVRKILKILRYQCKINKLPPYTGLLRVVIDGNNIPVECNELSEIDICLKRVLLETERFDRSY